MAAVDDFQANLSAARTYFAASNYEAARKQVTLAEIALAGIPSNVGGDGDMVGFRNDLARLRTAIDDQANRDAGRSNRIQQSRMINVVPR